MTNSKQNILIVDDDPSIVAFLKRLAESMGVDYHVALSDKQAQGHMESHPVDVAILDLNMPGSSGLQMLSQVKQIDRHVQVIIITGHGTVESAVQSLKMGAYEYLTKPFADAGLVERIVNRALEKVRLLKQLHNYETLQGGDFCGMIGSSAPMRAVYRMISSVAPASSHVMITGESGTGKELVARAIHEKSGRREGPFVVINCAALPDALLESELFGHEKGSFTGAVHSKKGLFTVADGGTIFLDEIGEVSPALQVKLLRVLQEGEVKPIGATTSHPVDVRVLAATNRDLKSLMQEGAFREDLFYRLHVIGIHMPPLRERREDIPLLAYHFLEKYAKETGKSVEKISVDAIQSLQDYQWVGNVRELENVIERAVVLCQGDALTAHDLPPKLLREVFYQASESHGEEPWMSLPYQRAKNEILQQFNQKYIAGLLRLTEGNISLASQRAGMDRNNFKKIIKRYDIDAKTFKKGR